MHMRRFLSRPCPNPRKTLALRIPIGPTRPGTHLERRRRADCGSSGPPRSHPYFCRTLDARARRAAHGTNIKCLASIDLTRPNKCNHRDGNTRDSRECTVKSAGHHGPIVSEEFFYLKPTLKIPHLLLPLRCFPRRAKAL